MVILWNEKNFFRKSIFLAEYHLMAYKRIKMSKVRQISFFGLTKIFEEKNGFFGTPLFFGGGWGVVVFEITKFGQLRCVISLFSLQFLLLEETKFFCRKNF